KLYYVLGDIIDSNYIPDRFNHTQIHVHLHPLFNNKKFKRHLIANIDNFSTWADLKSEIDTELNKSLDERLNSLFKMCKQLFLDHRSPQNYLEHLIAFYAGFKLEHNYRKTPIFDNDEYETSVFAHFDKFETLQQLQDALDFEIQHDTSNVQHFLNNRLSQ